MALALGHPDGGLGCEDAVGWSRLAQPNRHAWTDATPLRVRQNEPDRHDPEPKAVACYGRLRTDTQGMLLRFGDGRPVRAVTTQFLGGLTDRWVAEGQTALLLVWDNAAWHISQAVRAWRKAHNRRVKREGGCRIVVCPLPRTSPGLHRIEPQWVHGKRAIAEPARKLQVDELQHRICAYYDCELLAPIAQYILWACTSSDI
jgi:hypothetical protein